MPMPDDDPRTVPPAVRVRRLRRFLRTPPPSGPLFLRADPSVVDLLDPEGLARRAGMLDLDRVPVVEAEDRWTPKTPTLAFRVARGRLYRRETSPAFYGGFKVSWVSRHNERLVAEWLS